MKASKVFSLLFGVAQLILFIKLLDLIQGSDASSSNNTSLHSASSSARGVVFNNLEAHDRADSARAAVAFRSSSSSDAKGQEVKSVESASSNDTSLADAQSNGHSEGRGCPVGCSSL